MVLQLEKAQRREAEMTRCIEQLAQEEYLRRLGFLQPQEGYKRGLRNYEQQEEIC